MGCRLQTACCLVAHPSFPCALVTEILQRSGNLSALPTLLARTYEDEQPRDKVEGHSLLLAVLPVQVQQGRGQHKEADIADLKNKRHTQLWANPTPPRASAPSCVRRVLVSSTAASGSRGCSWHRKRAEVFLQKPGWNWKGSSCCGSSGCRHLCLPSLWGELLCPCWEMLVYLQLPGASKQLLCLQPCPSHVNPDPPGAAWMAPDPSSCRRFPCEELEGCEELGQHSKPRSAKHPELGVGVVESSRMSRTSGGENRQD